MNEYKCAMCGNVYEKVTPDEETMAECRSYFGNVSQDQCEVVCDDCWQKIHPEKHPHEVEEAIAKHLREGQ